MSIIFFSLYEMDFLTLGTLLEGSLGQYSFSYTSRFPVLILKPSQQLRTVGKASAFQAEKARWFGGTSLNGPSLSFPAVRGMITVPNVTEWLNCKHENEHEVLSRLSNSYTCELMFLYPSSILKCQEMDRLLFRHKKEWNNEICNHVDGHRDYHTKWSQKEKNTIWYHLYMESKKNYTN